MPLNLFSTDLSITPKNFELKKFFEITKQNTQLIDFKILDGLRGIAATYVLIFHSKGYLFMGTRKYAQLKDYSLWSFAEKLYFSALQAANLGTEFVILFFILSGFSIAFSLNRLPRINDFYIRRLIRIYPPYIVALTWAFAVFVIIKFTAPATLPANSKSVFDSFDSVINNIFYNCNI